MLIFSLYLDIHILFLDLFLCWCRGLLAMLSFCSHENLVKCIQIFIRVWPWANSFFLTIMLLARCHNLSAVLGSKGGWQRHPFIRRAHVGVASCSLLDLYPSQKLKYGLRLYRTIHDSHAPFGWPAYICGSHKIIEHYILSMTGPLNPLIGSLAAVLMHLTPELLLIICLTHRRFTTILDIVFHTLHDTDFQLSDKRLRFSSYI